MPAGAPLPMSDAASTRSTKIFGSIRKLGRKNSNASQTSLASVVPEPPSTGYRGPADLSGLSLEENALRSEHHNNPRYRSNSHSPLSPLANPSPATRRPDRPGMNAFTVPSNEPPPAYSTSPTSDSGPTLVPVSESEHDAADVPSPDYTPSASSAASSRPASMEGEESPYAFLTTFDTTLLIDDSGSMAGRSWREVSQALMTIAPIVTQHDADGIDIYFLNHKSSDPGVPSEGVAAGGYRGIKRATTVTEIFERVRPSGGTPTGLRVHAILKPYLAKLEAETAAGRELKPLNLIVLTDGVPSDDVESVLLTAAKKLDKIDAPPYQIGVQFFQVGNEEGAKEALMELDDDLCKLVEGGVRDIVDTVTWTGGALSNEGRVGLTGDGILKAVLGAVVKRLDRRSQ